MKNILMVSSKELKTFFTSPAAWVMIFAFWLVGHIFFWILVDQNQEASLRDIFAVMEFLMLLIVPLLTMRLIVEERNLGTMELLLTSGLKARDIVIGKFLGAWVSALALLSCSFLYYGIMEYFSSPDIREVLCGALGMVLETGFFVAIGLMMSSLTRHQLIAGLTSFVILLGLFMLPMLEPYARGIFADILKTAGTTDHLESFTSGFVGISDAVYYVTGIWVCLIVARYATDHRLWH